ncbi:uncharacterized protein P884DRAFT_26579 [Thermothelomyces heterothallicus CBS 202.75]|uniref:uncharacterized protein n=1 Tax=Thermothelomyces heterothallicus CBS 202.75 TaxID=1149848 RepID=UPI0037446B53
MSVMSILLDLVLLGLLLPSGRRRENQNSEKGSFTSSTLDTPPQVWLFPIMPPFYPTQNLTRLQLPPLSPIQHHRISLPYAAPETPRPDRNQHIPPTIFIVKPEDEPRVKATEKQLPPLPLPLPPSSPPSSRRIPSDTIIEPATGRLNRVALILALTRLQDPRTGTWAPTAELTGLLQAWAGGRRAISINLNIGGHGATALAHACLIDLCQTVWTAQREGTEAAVLSAEELRSLERVGWNLGWVAGRIRQAGAWLERRNW